MAHLGPDPNSSTARHDALVSAYAVRPDQSTSADSLHKVYLEITTQCDLDCRMCIRHTWDEPARSMSQPTFQAVLAGLRALPTVRWVQFGGFGEPTVHPQFWEFLLAVKQAGLGAELITNGMGLTQEAVDRLIDVELDHLVVSLDSASEAENGPLHPHPDKVKLHLRNLYRSKILSRSAKPRVTVQFVATKANIDQLLEIKRLGQQLGFDRVLVTNLIPYDASLAGQILYQRWGTARADTRPFSWNPAIDLPRFDVRSEASRVIEQLEWTGSNLRVLGTEASPGGMHCRFVHEGRVAIDPDGNVSPCLALLHPARYFFRDETRSTRAHRVGNIHRATLADIWNDPAYRAFRERVRHWQFAPCIDCGGCQLRQSNESDCLGNEFPCCGACLWAAGVVQCP